MNEILRVIDPPSVCSYLPREIASLETRAITGMGGAEYSDLLARGYRRFGWRLIRPACLDCRKCRSVRIPVDEFHPSGSENRILRKNADVRAELHPLYVTREHLDLFRRYHRFMHQHKGWPLGDGNVLGYGDSFLSGAEGLGRQWLYFEGDRLTGVALMDQTPDAISLVYCYYDPGWRARSPGTFSILNQLLYARQSGLKYAYLGYWIEECPSMQYKGRFRPREILAYYPPDHELPQWERA